MQLGYARLLLVTVSLGYVGCASDAMSACRCEGDLDGARLDVACGETACVAGRRYRCTGENEALPLDACIDVPAPTGGERDGLSLTVIGAQWQPSGLEVDLRLRTTRTDPVLVTPAQFELETSAAVLRPGLPGDDCQGSLRLLQGGAYACALIFDLQAGEEPRAVRFTHVDDRGGRTFSVSAPLTATRPRSVCEGAPLPTRIDPNACAALDRCIEECRGVSGDQTSCIVACQEGHLSGPCLACYQATLNIDCQLASAGRACEQSARSFFCCDGAECQRLAGLFERDCACPLTQTSIERCGVSL